MNLASINGFKRPPLPSVYNVAPSRSPETVVSEDAVSQKPFRHSCTHISEQNRGRFCWVLS